MGTRGSKKIFLLLITVFTLMLSPWGCADPPNQPQAEPNVPAVEAPQDVQRVTLEESKAVFDNNLAVFLDVRSESSYAASHILGALSIPLAELKPRIDELDPDLWIITYCT